MKFIIGLFMVSAVSTFSMAAANSGAPDLCPKFYCVAVSNGMDYHHEEPGYAYDDDLETAKAKAMKSCQESAGSCTLSGCDKNTGPYLHVPWACTSQW